MDGEGDGCSGASTDPDGESEKNNVARTNKNITL